MFAMSSSVSSLTPVRLTDVIDDIEIVEANLNDESSIEHAVAIARPELVAHLAAFSHVGKSFYRIDENIQTNVQGTVNLLKALEGDYQRFVYVGTGEVYGDAPAPFREDGPVSPVSPYAVSKYAAERFCRMFHEAYGWPIICLRPFNTYGPWQSGDRIVPEIIFSGLQRKSLRMTGGPPDPVVHVRRRHRRRRRPGAPGPGRRRRGDQRGRRRGDVDARPRVDDPRAAREPDRARDRRAALPAHRDLADGRRRQPGPRAARLAARRTRSRTGSSRRSTGTASTSATSRDSSAPRSRSPHTPVRR